MHLTLRRLACLAALAPALAAAAPQPHAFEIRRVLDPKEKRAKGSAQSMTVEYFRQDAKKSRRGTLLVEKTPALTEADLQPTAAASADFVPASVSSDPKGAAWWSNSNTTVDLGGKRQLKVEALRVRLTPAGRRKLAELTAECYGRQLAVFVDGRLIATPVVREVTDRSSIAITGMFDPTESVALAARINGLEAIGERPSAKRVPRLYPVTPTEQGGR